MDIQKVAAWGSVILMIAAFIRTLLKRGPMLIKPFLADKILVLFLALIVLLSIFNLCLAYKKSRPPVTLLMDKADVSFHIYGDTRYPVRLTYSNIWRWFYLRLDSQENQEIGSVFFISFDQPIKIGTPYVNSPDFKIPEHEVKAFTERFAIIAFSGKLPPGTLNISFRNE